MNLFSLVNSTGDVSPKITRLSPQKAKKSDFPVALIGENLPAPGEAEVYIGETLVEVYETNADAGKGIRLMVSYPTGGFAEVGMLNVTVKNTANGTQAMKVNGFEYISEAEGPRNLINCSQSGQTGGLPAGDLAVLLLAVAGLLVGLRHKKTGMAQ